MGNNTKIWLVVATSLVLVGCLIFAGVMTMLKWDFTKLSTTKYVTNEYLLEDSFESISLLSDETDVVFAPSDDGKTSVICYEKENTKHSVTVENGTLLIEANDTKKWYEYIGINFGTPKITVRIPQGRYCSLTVKLDTGDLSVAREFSFNAIDAAASTGDICNYASVDGAMKIKTSTGNICVKDITAEDVSLSVTTGKITAANIVCAGDFNIKVSTGKANAENISCKNFASTGDTGNVSMKNVVTTEKISVERSTGDVKLEGCDGTEIFIKTDTGDVSGSLLTDKQFVVKTKTGDVDVPETMNGGKCEISTNTGDVELTID